MVGKGHDFPLIFEFAHVQQARDVLKEDAGRGARRCRRQQL
jgi:hypothetical protein